MKRTFNNLIAIWAITFFTACSSSANDTQLVIDKYCELKMKEHNASAGAQKELAIAERKAYEKEVDDKYFRDNALYQVILDGMKKCDEAVGADAQTASLVVHISGSDTLSAYADAVTAGHRYCNLIEESIKAAQTGTEVELKRAVAVKLMFENNLEDSYKDNEDRRDSIFEVIKPCVQKEIEFKAGK